MKFKELKAMPRHELEEKLGQTKMDLVKTSAQVATGTTPKNSGNIRNMKKTIAKIKFLLKETPVSEKKAAKPAKNKEAKKE